MTSCRFGEHRANTIVESLREAGYIRFGPIFFVRQGRVTPLPQQVLFQEFSESFRV